MLLNELFIIEGQIKDDTGYIKWNWKSDLEDEEDEGYIPDGYKKKVLELSIIETEKQGEGHGAALMKKFLTSPDAKKAELIFLDPSPQEGANWGNKDEVGTVDKLVKFYSRFGFKHNPKSTTRRMWLVQKGSIPDDQLPT